LKWGHSDDHDLFDWRDQVANGKIERKNISIIQLDEEGNDSARWNLSEAWPAKWVGPSYNATSNEVAIETVEFAVEELKKG